MAKPKQKDIPRGIEKKKRKKRDVSPEVVPPDEDDDWMVVKKQRVTVLIPPLPSKVHFTTPDDIGESQVKEMPACSLGVSAPEQSVREVDNAKSLSPEPTIPPTETLHLPDRPDLTARKPPSLCHKIASDKSPCHSLRDGKGIGVGSTARPQKGVMMFSDGNAFLDRKMRMAFLEKKLKRAGGLENWLLSLGLSNFVRVFKNKSVNKFQLSNLTMKKLKDMGAYAVGPRRKLMHAIDCLCEPHCFQHM